MHPFDYTQAANASAAIEAGALPHSRFLAGGTSLVDLMKLNVEAPSHLIDVTPLPLYQIESLPDGGVRIGALVKNSDLAHSDIVRRQYPVLSEALMSGASQQLRNMATTGGNILQRTRCYYFRDTSAPCNKREPGTGCSAIGGYNRIHAILGTNEHCIASNPSDMNVAMTMLDAVVVVSGPNGERRVPFTDFHLLPGEHPEKETVLQPGDLITAVELPAIPYATRSRYVKVRDRASYAFALTSAAVALDIQVGIIREARIGLGGVGYKPWRAVEAEKLLAGQAPSPENFRAAAETALASAVPQKYNAFKIELAKRTMVRTLTAVSQMEA